MIKREKLSLIRYSKYLYLLFFIFTMASCMDEVEDIIEEADDEEQVIFDDTDFEATDWTEATHSKDADPNFDEVFEDQAVKRLDIVITEDRWQTMLDDMTDLYGTFGSRGGAGGGGPGGGFGGGDSSFAEEDPVFVPAEVFYEDKEWYRVGVRFKGNSSLQSSWQSGILKLSFKLDFDEFEDDSEMLAWLLRIPPFIPCM